MDTWQYYTLIILIIVFSIVPWFFVWYLYKKIRPNFKRKTSEEKKINIIQEICASLPILKREKVGGTFIIDLFNDVAPHIIDSQILDAKLSTNLLTNIFEGHATPLHDGAVIITSEGRLKSAAAYITKLSTKNMQIKKMGTRHRSALGLSEATKAIILVLSEETGMVTVFKNGNFTTLNPKDVAQKLLEEWIQ